MRHEPGRGNACHEDRRRGPAQVAADAVHRKAVPQPLGGYALVQDGEVHRVEGCVAQPGQGCSHHQPPIALRSARHQP